MERRVSGHGPAMSSRWLTLALRAQSMGASALLLCAACGSDPASSASPTAASSTAATTPSGTLPRGAAGAGGIVPGPTGSASPVTSPSSSAASTPAAAGLPGASATGTAAATPSTGILPCAVDGVLKSSCQSCHAASPIGGAPMPLVTYADLMKPAVTQPTRKVYELVKDRIHDTKRPMPPIGSLMPTDMAAIDAWVGGGAVSAPATESAACAPAMPTTSATGPSAMDGSHGKIVPGPGETCYDFKVHGGTTAEDTTRFDITDGEFYEQFYYKIPWGPNMVATAYATIADNAAVLHHWLLFSTNEAQPEGAHMTAPLPTLIGTDPVLLAGWAVGGPNLVAPQDVGFELPDPGMRTINVQWHFYNSTGKPQTDASSVQICTVPKATRKNIGNITWLGTEDLYGNKWFGGQGMPAHKTTSFTTTCQPGRKGMGANDSIHIMGFEPHMHRIGKHMQTSVKKADGTMMSIFDKPFNFGNETHYYVDYELKAGEQLITSCTFDNDNDFNVTFGESTDTEMCYQFTFAYPAHALTNGAASILGVPDTCWGSTTPTPM